MRNKYLLICFLIFFICRLPALTAENSDRGMVVKIIRLNNGNAVDLVETASMYKSPGGVVVADKRLNALIIKDYPENIERISALLKDTDIALPHARIKVQFLGVSSSSGTGLYGGAVKHGNQWHVWAKPDFTSTSGYQSTTMELLLMSGSSGYIRVCTSVPYISWFYTYAFNRGYIQSGIQFLNLSTGFYVTPRVTSDGVHLTIAPGITYNDGREERQIKFVEAQTEVFIRNGATVTVGVGDSSDSSSRGLISRIVGAGSMKSTETFKMIVSAKRADI